MIHKMISGFVVRDVITIAITLVGQKMAQTSFIS